MGDELLCELEFQAETSARWNYRDLIQKLRVKLTKKWSHNRPQLMLETDTPTVFFTIDIVTSLHTVRFYFRADNLYLIGYRVTTAKDSHWWECDNKPMRHLIRDQKYGFQTQWMGFTGDYPDLVVKAKRSLQKTPIGRSSLVEAINSLATAIEGDYKTKARSLMVVITMISEPTRLNPVFHEIIRQFYESTLVQPWMDVLIHSWADLTEIVVWADADERDKYILPTSTTRDNNIIIPPSTEPITTIAEVLQILGIMLGICFHERRSKRSSDDDDNDQGQCFVGSPLLQVFSVRIDNIDDEDPGELYGTITLNTGMYTEYIYNRPRENYQSIKPGQYATLVGPSSCISAMGDVTIDLTLTDKDTITWDDLIINHQIQWNARAIGNDYDKLISERVAGPHGNGAVNYAVIRNAVCAKVSIFLQEGGESTCEVYGEAYARYSDWDQSHDANVCTLLKTASKQNVDVTRFQPIPLLRSKIAVPVTSSLQITATIYDRDLISADDLIAKGTVHLHIPDILPGTTSKNIYGDDGNYVKVSVDWTYYV